MVPKSVVVGISDIDWKRDFAFPSENVKDNKEFPTGAKSETFINFIKGELRSLIEQEYRVKTSRTLIG